MEEIEITSWITLDAIKKKAETIETVGNLQTGHSMSVFCQIEDDYLELVYSDMSSNFLRRYEDRDEFESAIEQRKGEDGEAPYERDSEIGDDEDFSDDEEEEEEGLEAEESEDY